MYRLNSILEIISLSICIISVALIKDCSVVKENQKPYHIQIDYEINASPDHFGLSDSCNLKYEIFSADSIEYDVLWSSEYGEIKQKCENMYWMPPNDTGYFAIYFNLIYEDSLLFHDSLIVHVFDEGQLTLDAIQKLTQINYGSIAKFSYSLYDSLLHELSKQKYIVIPLYEYMGNINTGKVTVGLRHDVDHEPFKGLHMAEMEASYGFRSSFYLLHSAEYFGHWFKGRLYRYSSMIPLYKQYQSLDCEIGVHNDLISIMLLYDVDPYEFMHDEMKFYDNNNINIYGTASHGSALMRMLKMNNQWIFSNYHSYDVVEYNGKTYEIGKYSLEDYGFEYEAYHVGYNIYFSDAGGSWNVDNFETVLDSLRSAQAGDRIVILTHPCWWK